MKKIILFVLMIVASINLFSEKIPDDLIYYSKKAYYLRNSFLEDIKNNNNNLIELNDGYYLGTFDDEVVGYTTYKMKVAKNSEREIIFIFNRGLVYHYVFFQTKALSGSLLTFCNIRIHNNEDLLLCEINYYSEDDNVIHEQYFDPKTYDYYKYK